MMIDRVLQSIKNIPAFPETVHKVFNLMRKGDYSITEMSNIIKFDPSITANILKMSNSAYFGAGHRIKTVHDAVVYLGQENLIRVIQTAGISRFYRKPAKGYFLQPQELWKHCVSVALMSQILSRKIRGHDDPILYTAALLHDVGKIIMGEFVYDSLKKIIDLVSMRGYSFLDAEQEIIGINHAELGGKIAEHWNFPTELRDAIAFHHRPDLLEAMDAEGNKAENINSWLVYLADQACLMMGLDGGADGLAYKGLSEVIKKFDIHIKDIELSMVSLHEDLKQAQELIDIVPQQ
jgi:putative nucleotidyltransferase with HDIG domain